MESASAKRERLKRIAVESWVDNCCQQIQSATRSPMTFRGSYEEIKALHAKLESFDYNCVYSDLGDVRGFRHSLKVSWHAV